MPGSPQAARSQPWGRQTSQPFQTDWRETRPTGDRSAALGLPGVGVEALLVLELILRHREDEMLEVAGGSEGADRQSIQLAAQAETILGGEGQVNDAACGDIDGHVLDIPQTVSGLGLDVL